MRVAEYGRLLAAQRDILRITVPVGTPLHHTAADNLGMVVAYLQDGDIFLASGDWVNALAAFCYAFGWLHFGTSHGFFDSRQPACPLRSPLESPPERVREQLDEKARRYARLIDTARAAAVPAPEEGTASRTAAERILLVTAVYAEEGNRCGVQGQNGDALRWYSYGHGWLDAAVRAGLLRVISARELFTI